MKTKSPTKKQFLEDETNQSLDSKPIQPYSRRSKTQNLKSDAVQEMFEISSISS
jgi:hypothetical protein